MKKILNLKITIKHKNVTYLIFNLSTYTPHDCFIAIDKVLINSTLKITEEIAECLYLLSFVNQSNLTILAGVLK